MSIDSGVLSKIEGLKQRVDAIQRSHEAGGRSVEDLFNETFSELRATLQELAIGEEELVERNQELAVALGSLEEERRRHHDLFETAPVGYVITDLRGTILEANRAAATLLGTPKHLLTNKPLSFYTT